MSRKTDSLRRLATDLSLKAAVAGVADMVGARQRNSTRRANVRDQQIEPNSAWRGLPHRPCDRSLPHVRANRIPATPPRGHGARDRSERE